MCSTGTREAWLDLAMVEIFPPDAFSGRFGLGCHRAGSPGVKSIATQGWNIQDFT